MMIIAISRFLGYILDILNLLFDLDLINLLRGLFLVGQAI